VVGEGRPDILFIPGFVSNVEKMWDLPSWARMLERMSSFGRLVVFDKRGTGLSDRSLGSGSASDRMDDVRAVVEAAGLERPVVIGLSEGGPLAILYATTYPQRVRSLVLWGTYARLHSAPDYPIGMPIETLDAFVSGIAKRWGSGRALTSFLYGVPDNEEARRMIASYEKQATTPHVAGEILRHNVRIDVRPALPAIQVPTLVVHRSGDPIVPMAAARHIAEHVEGARLVELPGDFHVHGRVGGDDDVLDVIEEFVTGAHAEPEPQFDRVLATVLFTDIVGSTQRAAEFGDRAWTATLEKHNEVASREIDHHGGKLVKHTGDGLLATFDGPGRCVHAAQALREGVRSLGLDLRSGLHTGEINRRGDDIEGIGVHIAARVSALAGAGEILVSNTVKDLVIGSGIDFVARGNFQLKGVPGDWPLWTVTN